MTYSKAQVYDLLNGKHTLCAKIIKLIDPLKLDGRKMEELRPWMIDSGNKVVEDFIRNDPGKS